MQQATTEKLSFILYCHLKNPNYFKRCEKFKCERKAKYESKSRESSTKLSQINKMMHLLNKGKRSSYQARISYLFELVET